MTDSRVTDEQLDKWERLSREASLGAAVTLIVEAVPVLIEEVRRLRAEIQHLRLERVRDVSEALGLYEEDGEA